MISSHFQSSFAKELYVHRSHFNNMAWCFSVIVLSLLVHVITVGAQLNLYAAKHDVNSYLSKYNFEWKSTVNSGILAKVVGAKHVLILWFCFVFTELNFNFDLYIIENGEPVKLLEDSRAFYSFMSPLQASVKGVKLSWFSSPQVCARASEGRDQIFIHS